ncbi:MAG: pentapeptide repeat-containing protein [Cyanobacteria bacterium]|nr:pentapeptide repeat-containing protein [Cyanobacteriota bacterium]MDW8202298.1 pentapeptide repeat-containing protein [Cyanobacteriota bacterium SKYGB_h_bin112]
MTTSATQREIRDRYAAGERNFAHIHLAGEDLSYADLRGVNLQGANLRGCDLSFADLEASDLTGADLRGCLLFSTNLRGATLDGALFTRADFDSYTRFPEGFDPTAHDMTQDA